jgi:hypothetical protein
MRFDGADVEDTTVDESIRPTFLDTGPCAQRDVFHIDGNDPGNHQTPMFGRGRLDHLGVRAAPIDLFSEIRRRLVERGSSDGFVADLGLVRGERFTDGDDLGTEVRRSAPTSLRGIR